MSYAGIARRLRGRLWIGLCVGVSVWLTWVGSLALGAQKHGPWRDHDFYVSGSPAMVRATLRTLAEMQVPPIRIRYDAFGDS